MTTHATIEVGYVGPNQLSGVQLSTGVYSLSSRSNVPYVSLVGASGFYKIFSWGEVVEVPCGQICTVKNESYHGGDIYISSGAEPFPIPARITVPVDFSAIENINGIDYNVGAYPADVRRARRAFLYYGGRTTIIDIIVVVGVRLDGSHNTFDEIHGAGGFAVPGVGYVENWSWPAATDVVIPLGYRSMTGDNRPHNLLTIAKAYLPQSIETGDTAAAAYYTMEY